MTDSLAATENFSETTTNSKRRQVEAYVLQHLQTMDPTGSNAERYRAAFAKMDDAAFDTFMTQIKEGKRTLVLYAPNMVVALQMPHLLAAARAVNCKLFERLRLWSNGRWFITKHEYLVLLLPVRRLKQYLMDKISVPESDQTIDLFTGQVVKPDKGSSLSLVEMQTLDSKGLHKALIELTNVRGGNVPAYASFKAQLEETGTAALTTTDMSGAIRSVVVADVQLKAMHLDTNLASG